MQKRKYDRLRKREGRFIFFMILPSVLPVLVLTYYPLMRGIVMAFQNYTLFNMNKIKFIGFKNFETLFAYSSSNMFYKTLSNTAQWVLVSLFFQLLIGFVLAMVLRRAFFGKRVYQGMIFFPWAISGFVIGIMWRWMFNGTAGVINDLLIKMGILAAPYGFLSEVGSALNAAIVANIWYGIPFFTIMITAALQGVPEELYEAAEVDGAGGIRKFFAITLPHIRPVLVLTVLLRVIWIFNFPELIQSMTGGAPAGSSHIVTSYMMEKIRGLDYGMGSAIGLICLLFLSLYTVIYLSVTRFSRGQD